VCLIEHRVNGRGPKATEIKRSNITHHEKQNPNRAAHQFFRSLLGGCFQIFANISACSCIFHTA